VLGNQTPCLAELSFFTLKDVSPDAELVGTAINVLPVSGTRTVAVFSYASQRRRIVQTAFEGIFKSTWGLQKYELSKLILGRVSNVLISPRHFKA
jgi:hypothetical protein